MHADDCAAAIHGGHAPEVPVLPRNRFGAAFDPLSDGTRRMQTRLNGDFGNAGQIVVVHHVTNDEHLGMARQRYAEESL